MSSVRLRYRRLEDRIHTEYDGIAPDSQDQLIPSLRELVAARQDQIRQVDALIDDLKPQYFACNSVNTAATATGAVGFGLLFSPAAPVGGLLLAAGAVVGGANAVGDLAATVIRLRKLENCLNRTDQAERHLNRLLKDANIDITASLVDEVEPPSNKWYKKVWRWLKMKKDTLRRKLQEWIRLRMAANAGKLCYDSVDGVVSAVKCASFVRLLKAAKATAPGVMAADGAADAMNAFVKAASQTSTKVLGGIGLAFGLIMVLYGWLGGNKCLNDANEARAKLIRSERLLDDLLNALQRA